MKNLLVLDASILDSPDKLRAMLALKGGPGSGYHGHAGRPGKRGGSAPAGTAPAASDAIASFEKSIFKQSYESVLVIDDDGNLFSRTDGEDDHVYLPDELFPKLKGLRITHNHPGGWEYPESNPQSAGRSFSPSDIAVACRGRVKEIRAVSRKYIHSMKPPPGGWNLSYWENELKPIVDKVTQQVTGEFWGKISVGKMFKEEASAKHWDTIWRRVAEQTGLDYSRVEHDYNT